MTSSLFEKLNDLALHALDQAPIPIIICDGSEQVIFANQVAISISAAELHGEAKPKHSLIGQTFSATFGISVSNLSRISPEPFRITLQDTEYQLHVNRSQLDDSNIWIVYFEKLAGSRKREILLEKEASTDSLTGLANRRAFQRTVEANQNNLLSLAIIDIDHFKAVNDGFGHLAGDDTLCFIGERLNRHFGSNALLVSRMGGDEFSVLFQSDSPTEIIHSLEQFRQDVERSFVDASERIKVTVSVGAALSTTSNHEARRLLTQADRCLYDAKTAGRNVQCHKLLDDHDIPD